MDFGWKLAAEALAGFNGCRAGKHVCNTSKATHSFAEAILFSWNYTAAHCLELSLYEGNCYCGILSYLHETFSWYILVVSLRSHVRDDILSLISYNLEYRWWREWNVSLLWSYMWTCHVTHMCSLSIKLPGRWTAGIKIAQLECFYHSMSKYFTRNSCNLLKDSYWIMWHDVA